jgi:ABC-type uncharacterized transport system substrate-binding protein
MSSCLRRREFIAALGSAAAVWPLATRAQQRDSRKVPRIGWLVPGTRDAQGDLEEYRRGMRELGYVEGRTIMTKCVYADGRADRLSELAAMLVADKVEVIVTAGTPGCLAAKQATSVTNRIPAIYEDGEVARAGGLMAYGPSIQKMFHRAAGYVDKIIKGAKPADLPVEQPITFELVINLKTAKAIGVSIPQSFLWRADEVIE